MWAQYESAAWSFLQVPKSSQFDMHLLHWSNGNALFPRQDSETQVKRLNLQKVRRIQKHQRESASFNKQETACEPDTPLYWFQSWIIYAPSRSITLYHSSSLLCFFHQIVDPAARLIRSHLKFAKDFASRALRLSKTAGSTPGSTAQPQLKHYWKHEKISPKSYLLNQLGSHVRLPKGMMWITVQLISQDGSGVPSSGTSLKSKPQVKQQNWCRQLDVQLGWAPILYLPFCNGGRSKTCSWQWEIKGQWMGQ